MPDNNETLSLKLTQHNQILEQYRMSIYNLELRFDLLVRMMEEKGIFAAEEFQKRWPVYLQKDIGVVGSDGVMEGSLKVTFYGQNGGK